MSGFADRQDGPFGLGGDPLISPFVKNVSSWWWVELLAGIAWIAISIVILKFNHASVETVGILTGVLFLVVAAEQFFMASMDRKYWPLWGLFGVLMGAAGIICLINPTRTFAGFADILGFVFLLIGIMWMVEGGMEQKVNPVWWLSLISGVLMIVMAFWVSGQFFIQRAFTLLIFTGVWAMMKGITDLIRAFQMRSLGS